VRCRRVSGMPEEAPSGRGGVRGHRPSDRSVRPGLVAAPALLNALIHRSAWKGYSPKFGVASAPPSSATRDPERPGGTVLGSKRTYQVAFVATLCIKGWRLVTLQLPENFSPTGPGLDRTSQVRRSRKSATASNVHTSAKIRRLGDASGSEACQSSEDSRSAPDSEEVEYACPPNPRYPTRTP
jgi:hypothetical protein